MNKVAAVFDTFENAMNAHRSIFTLLIEQGYISHRDFLNIVHANNHSYTHVGNPSDDIFVSDMYDMMGWTYLCGTTVEEYKNGKYIIVMPEMITFGIRKNNTR